MIYPQKSLKNNRAVQLKTKTIGQGEGLFPFGGSPVGGTVVGR